MAGRAVGHEDTRTAIVGLQQEWEQRFRRRDAAGLATLYTDDCVRIPNGEPTSIGRDALAAAYAREMAEMWEKDADVALTTDEVVVAGEYAFARGTDTLRFTENGEQVEYVGKWVATYRREPDGGWKYFWSTYCA